MEETVYKSYISLKPTRMLKSSRVGKDGDNSKPTTLLGM